MRKTNYIKTCIRGLLTLLLIAYTSGSFAQTTLCAPLVTTNSNGKVTFNFRNNNAFAVVITDIQAQGSSTVASNTEAWYRPSALAYPNAAAFPALTTANWTQFGNSTAAMILNTNVSLFGGGLSLTIPAGATYGICISVCQSASPTVGSLRYSTLVAGTSYSYPGGGCDILSGGPVATNASAAGAPRLGATTFANVPRGFLGCVVFQAAVPCSGTPAPGNTIASANPACSGASFTLSLQNSTTGTGVTYLWQSADDAAFTINAVNMGTGSTQSASQTAPKYYRCQVTCSAGPSTGTSNPVLVTMNTLLNCYCAASHTSCSGDGITNVTLNTLNNTSVGCPGSGNYTRFFPGVSQTTLVAGSAYTLTIAMQTDPNQFCNAWIDYNLDGVLSAGEAVGATYNGAALGTFNFTVPIGATPGLTRLRVKGGVDGTFTTAQACGNDIGSTFGEIEDYDITVISPTPCSGSPTPGTISLTGTGACGGASYAASGYDVSLNITYQWESSTDNVNFFPISGATGFTYSTPGAPVTTYYRFAVTCTNGPTTAYSNTMTLAAGSTPAAPITTGATRCGVGTVNMSASGSGTLNWFQSSNVAGPIINTGTTYSPSIASTTNYYVFADPGSVVQTVGPPVTLAGTTAYASATTNWQTFNVLSNNGVIINTVDFRANAATPVNTPLTIQLENSSGTPLGTATTLVTSPGNIQTMTLNFFVPQGTGYRFRPIQNPNLQYHQSGFTNPYTLPGQVSITGWDGGTTLYVFFYNWQVRTACFSAVSPVTATVTTPPALTITPSGSTSYCGTGSVGLTASGTGYVNFNWSPATGLSGTTGATVTANPSVTTTYTVLADDGTGPNGCANTQTVTITVHGPPFANATASSSTICLGATSNLGGNGGSSSIKQVGITENAANNTIAVYDSWNSNVKTQILYTVAELNAAGLFGPSNITSIGFKVANKLSTGSLSGFTIRMAAVATAPPLTTTYLTPTFTTVFTGTVATALGWNTHNFSTPFPWNGTSNVLVEICNGVPSVQGFDQIFNTPTASFQTIQANLLGCTALTGNAILNRPNTRFTGGAVNYLWSPATDLSANNIESPVFTGNSLGSFPYSVLVTDPANGCTATSGITMNVVPPPAGGTVSGPATGCAGAALAVINETGGSGGYQWQVDISAGGFNDIIGATASSLNYTPTSGGTYTFRNRRNAGGCADAFSTVTLTVAIGPAITVSATTATPATVCSGLTTQLNVSASGDGDVSGSYCTTLLYTTGCTDATPDEINDFTISNLSHLASGCSGGTAGYGDFTYSQPAILLLQNTNYPWTIVCPFASSENVGIWIDLNKNGSFAEAGEFFGNVGPSVSSTITGTLNVGSAASGTYRMRVRLVFGTAQSLTSSCTGFTFGEVHDYKVSIGNGGWAFNYSWAPAAGLTPSANVVNPTTPALSSQTVYTVTITEPASGCTSTASVTVGVNAAPDPAANSNSPICEGASLSLTADNNASGQSTGNTYSWTGPGSYSSLQQNPTVTSTATTANSGNYTVVVTNQFLCTASISTSVTVNPNPALTVASVTGVSCVGLCDGYVAFNPTGGTGAGTYLVTDDLFNFSSNDTIFGYCETGSIGNPSPNTAYVVDGNGCTSNNVTYSIGHISAAPPSASVLVPPINNLPASACNGTVVSNINVPAVALATQYIWDGPTGTTFNGSGNPYTSATPTANITFGNPNGSGYYIGIQAANGCGTSTRKVQWVRGTVGVPAAISGVLTACPNTSENYSTTAVTGATSYIWTVSGDATVIGAGLTATVNFGPTFTSGTLCVSASTGCYNSPTKCITISRFAPVVPAFIGTFTACIGQTLTYSVPAQAGVASYQWTLPPNTSGSSTTNSINVTFNAGFFGGDLTVRAVSICGDLSGPRTRTIVWGVPLVPPFITGPLTGLCGQTIVYSCPAQAGATFTWTVPAGATINSGQGSNAISVTFGIFTTSTVCVSTSNACGASAQRCITVIGRPNTPGVITATPATWCANTLGIQFNVNVTNLTGSYTLSWLYPGPTVATYVAGGGNTTSLTLDWLSGSGPVNVTASNACGNQTRNSTQASSCREGEEVMAYENSSLQVYPNPTSGNVNIEFSSLAEGNAQLTVVDVTGRTVVSDNISVTKGLNQSQLDLTKVAKGIYMLNVNSAEGTSKVKIVVE